MKSLILEHLHRLAEDKGYRVAPQDYSKEFGQTGSGKAIFGKQNLAKADPAALNKAKNRIQQALNVGKDYQEAYLNGKPDENGTIHFKTSYLGQVYDCQIPTQFKSGETAGGQKTNYQYYFDVPEMGDGAVQVAMGKDGYMQVKQVRSKTDMSDNPHLSSAADAGYDKEHDGRTKYFNVKIGVRGKFQGDNPRYSVFPTPVIDANVKANIGFKTEILDFMQGGGDYTSDEKGREISNKMDFDKKLEKIRKDAEQIIGKPIVGNPIWIKFRDELKLRTFSPEKQAALDTTQMTKEFLRLYKSNGGVQKSEIGMGQDEREAWEKEQKEKLARIAAAKARRGMQENDFDNY